MGQSQEEKQPEDCQDVTVSLADVLTRLVSVAEEQGRQEAFPDRASQDDSMEKEMSWFHVAHAPKASVHDYVMRLAKHFQCSRECFVLCLIYIQRIIDLHPDLKISSLSIHKLLLTSVVLAVKFNDDSYASNKDYARIGGVQTRELNSLEARFLKLIGWRLYVAPSELDRYRGYLSAPAPKEKNAPAEVRVNESVCAAPPGRRCALRHCPPPSPVAPVLPPPALPSFPSSPPSSWRCAPVPPPHPTPSAVEGSVWPRAGNCGSGDDEPDAGAPATVVPASSTAPVEAEQGPAAGDRWRWPRHLAGVLREASWVDLARSQELWSAVCLQSVLRARSQDLWTAACLLAVPRVPCGAVAPGMALGGADFPHCVDCV